MINLAVLTLPLIEGKPQVIIPAGEFNAPNGSLGGTTGPWFLNEEDGLKLIEKINNPKFTVDVLIDYEHQNLLTIENGKPVPAAGWIKRDSFTWDSELGLIANSIRWTNEAANLIKEGAYRYLSPVFVHDKNGVPIDLQSVAITNRPAIKNIQELAINSQGAKMSDKKDIQIEEKTSNNVVNEIKPEEEKEVNTAVLATENKNTGANTKTPTPSQYPMIAALTNQVAALGAENANLRNELADLKNQLAESAREGLISAALSDGRLYPAMEPWARALDIVALSDFLSKAKPIVALTSLQTQQSPTIKKEEGTKAILSDYDLSVCKQMNIDPKVYLATQKKIEELYK